MKLAIAGGTMLGRSVAERLAVLPPTAFFAEGVVAAAHEADLFILNLECAISGRGERWPEPSKPFFFRAHVFHGVGVMKQHGSVPDSAALALPWATR